MTSRLLLSLVTLALSGSPVLAKPQHSESTKKTIEEYKTLALKNDCSRGKSNMSGTWRFIGETRTPDYENTITIDGTRYEEHMSGKPDGKATTAKMDGEIRCVFKNRVLVQIDRVTPEGAFGNSSGDLYPCDVLTGMSEPGGNGAERMMLICYFDWDLRTAAGLEFEYERVSPAKTPVKGPQKPEKSQK